MAGNSGCSPVCVELCCGCLKCTARERGASFTTFTSLVVAKNLTLSKFDILPT